MRGLFCTNPKDGSVEYFPDGYCPSGHTQVSINCCKVDDPSNCRPADIIDNEGNTQCQQGEYLSYNVVSISDIPFNWLWIIIILVGMVIISDE